MMASEQDFYVEEDRSGQTQSEGDQGTIGAGLAKSRILTPKGEQALFKRLRFITTRSKAIQSTLNTKRPSKKSVAEIARLKVDREATIEEITTANLRLVASIARKLSRSEQDFEEFFSEGTSILLYAIEKFDYARGFRFSTYATHSIQRHLYRVIERRQKRSQRELGGNQEMLANETQPDDIEDISPAASMAITEEALRQVNELLDDREKTIVLGRFGLDGSDKTQSFQALGEQLGLSKERTRQIYNKGIEKLGKVMKPFADQLE